MQEMVQANKYIKTAIIYSVDHLFSYIVEIKEGSKRYFLSDGSEVIKFGNLDDVRKIIISLHVKVAYLALSKTSEETDLTTCHTYKPKFDYSIFELGYKS